MPNASNYFSILMRTVILVTQFSIHILNFMKEQVNHPIALAEKLTEEMEI
jgi:hypothetical protein